MPTYTHTLTDTEQACGVTLEQVADVLLKVLILDGDDAVMLPRFTAPALAGSVARCAFGGDTVEFSHLSSGYPVYRRARA